MGRYLLGKECRESDRSPLISGRQLNEKISTTLMSVSLFLLQIHLRVKWLPSRTNTLTLPSATWRAATRWTCSWASGWRGPSRPFTGTPRVRCSRWTRAPWPFPSPSSPSWRWCVCCYCSTAGVPACQAVSSVAHGHPSSSPSSCSCPSGSSTSCCPPWRRTATCLASETEGNAQTKLLYLFLQSTECVFSLFLSIFTKVYIYLYH